MIWLDLTSELLPDLLIGNLDACVKRVELELDKIPPSPFHLIKEENFTNDPKQVAQFVDSFIENIRIKYEIKAIYAETNGFDINPDRWFFDLFAFEEYGGRDDYDWLANYSSVFDQSMVLKSMEELQSVYASKAGINLEYTEARGLSSLLIVIKFQKLIQSSVPNMKYLQFPLLVTSHDYDFIYEFKP